MVRFWFVVTFGFLFSSCATSPIFSAELLIQSSNEELSSANAIAKESKDSYKQYLGAHKHMIASKPIKDREKMLSLHVAMKDIRKKAKAIMAQRKEIQADNELLKKELANTSSVSEKSKGFKKIAPQVALYGHGKKHPGLEKVKNEFNKSVEVYTKKVGELSGYFTNASALKKQFDQKVNLLNSRIEAMIARAKSNEDFLQQVSKLKLEMSDLSARFFLELPTSSNKVLLFPSMVSYSIIDKLNSLSGRIEEMQKKIP